MSVEHIRRADKVAKHGETLTSHQRHEAGHHQQPGLVRRPEGHHDEQNAHHNCGERLKRQLGQVAPQPATDSASIPC